MELGSIIWIVLIGGMFFLMMRKSGCCGSHSGKEGHDRDGGNKSNEHNAGTESEHKKGCH